MNESHLDIQEIFIFLNPAAAASATGESLSRWRSSLAAGTTILYVLYCVCTKSVMQAGSDGKLVIAPIFLKCWSAILTLSDERERL